MIEYGHSEFYYSKNNLFEKVYTGLIQPFYRELIEVSKIKDIYNEDFKKQLTKVIDVGIGKTAFDKGFEYREEAYVKYLMGVLISNQKETLGKGFGGAEDNRQEVYTKKIISARRNYLEGYVNKHKVSILYLIHMQKDIRLCMFSLRFENIKPKIPILLLERENIKGTMLLLTLQPLSISIRI